MPMVKRMGTDNGRIIRHNTCKSFAPSMRAASLISSGMPSKKLFMTSVL